MIKYLEIKLEILELNIYDYFKIFLKYLIINILNFIFINNIFIFIIIFIIFIIYCKNKIKIKKYFNIYFYIYKYKL